MALDLIRDCGRRRARRHGARDGNRRGLDPAGEGDTLRHRRRRAHLRRVDQRVHQHRRRLGMAARAELPLEDMEFWQFHPDRRRPAPAC
jgi:succinate dehydrogenase/fumarate reductase flavoprotein subunit